MATKPAKTAILALLFTFASGVFSPALFSQPKGLSENPLDEVVAQQQKVVEILIEFLEKSNRDYRDWTEKLKQEYDFETILAAPLHGGSLQGHAPSMSYLMFTSLDRIADFNLWRAIGAQRPETHISFDENPERADTNKSESPDGEKRLAFREKQLETLKRELDPGAACLVERLSESEGPLKVLNKKDLELFEGPMGKEAADLLRTDGDCLCYETDRLENGVALDDIYVLERNGRHSGRYLCLTQDGLEKAEKLLKPETLAFLDAPDADCVDFDEEKAREAGGLSDEKDKERIAFLTQGRSPSLIDEETANIAIEGLSPDSIRAIEEGPLSPGRPGMDVPFPEIEMVSDSAERDAKMLETLEDVIQPVPPSDLPAIAGPLFLPPGVDADGKAEKEAAFPESYSLRAYEVSLCELVLQRLEQRGVEISDFDERMEVCRRNNDFLIGFEPGRYEVYQTAHPEEEPIVRELIGEYVREHGGPVDGENLIVLIYGSGDWLRYTRREELPVNPMDLARTRFVDGQWIKDHLAASYENRADYRVPVLDKRVLPFVRALKLKEYLQDMGFLAENGKARICIEGRVRGGKARDDGTLGVPENRSAALYFIFFEKIETEKGAADHG